MIWRARKELLRVNTPFCHASTLAWAGDILLAAWFGGEREGADDTAIYLTRRVKGEWEAARRMTDADGEPKWNPVLEARDGRIYLYYKTGRTIPAWRTMAATSDDGGETFSAPVPFLVGGEAGRGPVRSQPLRLSGGRVLYPGSSETESRWDAFVDYSDDGGKTVRRGGTIPLWRGEQHVPVYYANEPAKVTGLGVIQPALYEDGDRVRALLRSTEGRILRSDSSDGGAHFSAAYDSGLPSNNSGIALQRLSGGRVLLCLNPIAENWGARTPLSLYVSDENGEAFRPLMHLEIGPGEYSYPTLLARGCQVTLSYTWRRTRVALWDIEIEPDEEAAD